MWYNQVSGAALWADRRDSVFKRNFLIYTLSGAAAAGVVSDVLMIALAERFSFSDKDNMYPYIFILPTAFACLCAVIIKLWSRRTIRRRRAYFETLNVREEYSFFRNCACILTVLALANTCWLYYQITGIMETAYADEYRKMSLMLSAQPQEYRSRMIRELAVRQTNYSAAAQAVFWGLLAVKGFIYLFSARGFVRQYHEAVPSTKPRQKHRRRSSDPDT